MCAHQRLIVLVLSLLLPGAVGCGDDDPGPVVPPQLPESYPFAGTPKQLMTNF